MNIVAENIASAMDQFRSLGYQRDTGEFSIGRPDHLTVPLIDANGVSVVAKFYPSNHADFIFSNLQNVWASSFGTRRNPPGLPKPLCLLRDIGAIIMERISGRPLAESETIEETILEDAMRLLLSLHRSDAKSSRKRGHKQIVRSMKRKAHSIVNVKSEFGQLFERTVELLEKIKIKDRDLLPGHGDFSPRNIIVSNHRLVLIDWDRFQMSDPARDVTYFGAWMWANAIRRRREPDWSGLMKSLEIYESLAPGYLEPRRINFYLTCGLIRISHSLVHLWPDEKEFVPAILEEARCRLDLAS